MSDGLLHKIDVTIVGRKFPIKVTGEEEVIVRNIEKKLNQQIHEFQLKYADKDKMDCIIMTLLTLAFENAKEDKGSDQDQLVRKLSKIEQLVDSALS